MCLQLKHSITIRGYLNTLLNFYVSLLEERWGGEDRMFVRMTQIHTYRMHELICSYLRIHIILEYYNA